MGKLKEWQGKIDNLSMRERGAVFFCTLFVVYFVWDMFLLQPLQIEEKRVKSQLQQKQTEQLALNTQIQNMVVDKRTDPNKADREKLHALKSQLEKIESQVQTSTQQLVSPNNMAVILETVLLKVKGLELLAVRGLGAEAVIKPKDAVEDNKATKATVPGPEPAGIVDNAYKHGLRIEFEGDYMSTLEYIRELENLEWGFFWESLEFKVNEYPDSTVAITVFTLSLDENWIGIGV
jgi:MSHA biogenesis protein MshJ